MWGHPDKLCDQISDAVLDEVLRQDPNGRVACEVLANTALIVVAGEISADATLDIPAIVAATIERIGYTPEDLGFTAGEYEVQVSIDQRSADIAQGVDRSDEAKSGATDEADLEGAGDQGMMFGYATDETEALMPMPVQMAHRLAERLAAVRKDGTIDYLGPDGKTQVTIRYADEVPVAVEKLLISTQHAEGIETDQVKTDLIENVVREVVEGEYADLWEDGTLEEILIVNPTGRFVTGGPKGDAGLTGRKIIVDTYGGAARHGGGAFSGKDPSKVDRSAAYAARHVAKNVVAAALASRCEVQVAYAIGMAHPVSLSVNTFGTGTIPDSEIVKLITEDFDLRPLAFRTSLDLHRPIYAPTAAYGHFGREEPDFTWERTDRSDSLRSRA
jgi:S-adenosylmethionine synthetase